MTLHLVNKCDEPCWHLLLQGIAAGDALVLTEEAVFAALPQHALATRLAAAGAQCRLHAQAEDLAVRGISGKIRADVAPLSYRDLVALCLQHTRVVSWR
jgi:sulfur relay protein TusB/DsrH